MRARLAELPKGRALLVALLVVVLAVLLFSGGSEEPAPSAGTPGPPAGAPGPGGAPAAGPAARERPPAAAAAPAEVMKLVEEMSIEDKLAQLILVGFEGTDADAPTLAQLRKRDLGGIVLTSDNYEDRGQLERLTREAEAVAARADHLPPWIMAVQEGGEFSAFEDLPPSKAPADIGSPKEGGREAADAAKALTQAGVNGTLAPVLDVAPESGGALGPRAYSDSAEDVVDYAVATVSAYEQGEIFAAAKHFPGLGGASQPTEVGPANVGLSFEELELRDLKPFRAAVEAGVPGMLVGHGTYASDDFVTPASLSPSVLTDLLRDQLGFEGLAISDDLTSPAVTATIPTPEAAIEAIGSGADMVYVGGAEGDQEDAYLALLGGVRKGAVSPERIDEALVRVLSAKRELGLLDEKRRGG